MGVGTYVCLFDACFPHTHTLSPTLLPPYEKDRMREGLDYVSLLLPLARVFEREREFCWLPGLSALTYHAHCYGGGAERVLRIQGCVKTSETVILSVGFGAMRPLMRSLNAGVGSIAKRFQNLFLLLVSV